MTGQLHSGYNVTMAIKNDVKPSTKSEQQDALEKIHHNSEFTLSFLALLMGSTTITTLGLLLNATAIVIGGMIVSPLMWPLLKISLSISYGYKRNLGKALGILLLSIFITVATAVLITQLSPLKALNDEILSRTTPSLFHLFIGLAAGGIATLAITHKRISEGLAGVAVATSLLPPLATMGIGLALDDTDMAARALALFGTNMLSIILVATVVFSIIGFRTKRGEGLRNTSVLLTAAALVLLAIPLFSILRTQSLEIEAYTTAKETLSEYVIEQHPEASVSDVTAQISTVDTVQSILVTAHVLIPEDTTLTYQSQQELTQQLESQLGMPVELRLAVQQQLAIVRKKTSTVLEEYIVRQLRADHEQLSIQSLTAHQKAGTWHIFLVVRGKLEHLPTMAYVRQLETMTADEIKSQVDITLELVPRYFVEEIPVASVSASASEKPAASQ